MDIEEKRIKGLIATRLDYAKLAKVTEEEGITIFRECGRCDGKGNHWAKHVMAGVCFACNGTGQVGFKTYKDVDRYLKRALKKRTQHLLSVIQYNAMIEKERAQEIRDNWVKAMLAIRLDNWKREAKAAKAAKMEWVGEVGERLKGLKLEVVFRKPIETRFGTTNLLIMLDQDGNKFKAFYAGNDGAICGLHCGVPDPDQPGCYWAIPNKPATRGYCLKLAGTVKEHETYNGEKATVLTRLKAEDL